MDLLIEPVKTKNFTFISSCMYLSPCVLVCVCVCARTCEREREGKRGGGDSNCIKKNLLPFQNSLWPPHSCQ